MKKIIVSILAICLIACVIAIPAYAVTPTIKVPNIKVSITKAGRAVFGRQDDTV